MEFFAEKASHLRPRITFFFFLPDGESKALTRLVFTTAREVIDF